MQRGGCSECSVSNAIGVEHCLEAERPLEAFFFASQAALP